MSKPSWQSNLERAQYVRTERAKLRQRLELGEATVAEVLREPPDYALTWSVFKLFQAQRHWGPTKARRFLRRYAVAEGRRVGDLHTREVTVLAGEFERVEAARLRRRADRMPA